MKRIFKTFIVALCLTAVACTDYQVDIDDLNNRVDNLETNKIATITQQIQSINASIPALQSTSSELKTLVNSLKTTVEGYDAAIAENGEALTQLKSDIEKSIEEIKKSIEEGQGADKQEMLDALNVAKAEIEAQIAALQTDTQNKLDQMNEVVENLQEKDASIEARIDSLKIFVNEELVSQKDWATKTFATLQQQQAIQNDITSIKSDISSLQSALTALEDRITREYTAAINSAAASLRSEIAATANQITDAYKAAIEEAKKEITDAYEKAIEQAISDLETKLKGWVNEQLTGYYTTAEIKSKIDSLHGVINNQFDVQQAYIDALEKVLGGEELITKYNTDSKTIARLIDDNADNFTKLYNALTKKKANMTNDEKTLIEAIVADGGVISDLVKEKVKNYVDGLQSTQNWITTKFSEINTSISNLNNSVSGLRTDLNNLSSKLTGFINGRIQSLSYIPTTVEGDHWVGAVDDEAFGDITLFFRVSPASMVKEITKEQVSAKVTLPESGGELYYSAEIKDVFAYSSLVTKKYGNAIENYEALKDYNDILVVIIDAKNIFRYAYCRRAEVSVSVKDIAHTNDKETYYDVASEFVTVNAEHYFMQYSSTEREFALNKNYGKFALNSSKKFDCVHHGYYDYDSKKYLSNNFVEVENGTTELDAVFAFKNDNIIPENIKVNRNITALKFGQYWDNSVTTYYPHGDGYDEYSGGWRSVQLKSGENVFSNCPYLTSVDFGIGLSDPDDKDYADSHSSALETDGLTSFNYMFLNCTSLKDLGMEYCNTASVQSMVGMFQNCDGFTELDLSYMNTESLTNVSNMFMGSDNLESVNLSGWNVSKITNFSKMFADCPQLNEVNINLNNLTFNSNANFEGMFRKTAITELVHPFASEINISGIKELFKDCTALTRVDLSSNKVTVTTTDMSEMFKNCGELTVVNLSNWTIPDNAKLDEMFYECKKLEKIYLENWKLSGNNGDLSYNSLLNNCSSLTDIYLKGNNAEVVTMIKAAIESAGLESVKIHEN